MKRTTPDESFTINESMPPAFKLLDSFKDHWCADLCDIHP